MGRRKSVVLIPPPESRVIVDDPKNLGPLPSNGLAFLGQLGARRIEIVVKDGRSWIIAGVNEWRGSLRPFIARVFDNGFVRDYMAIPVEHYAEVVKAITKMAEIVKEVNSGGEAEEDGKE
jgi:hypothetical protein